MEMSSIRSMNNLDMNSSSGTNAAGYMPALDGLRALAVFAVIAYHLDLQYAQGGLLGVSLFFRTVRFPDHKDSAGAAGKHLGPST